MTFNQFKLLWQSKDLHSDVIGEKNIIYLKTFSAKKKPNKKPTEIKAEMQNFACSAEITFKRLTSPVKH